LPSVTVIRSPALPLDRRGGERVLGRHPGERCEQLAHARRVLCWADAEPRAACVLQQRVLRRRVDEAVDRGMAGHQTVQAVSAVLELSVDGLRKVRFLFGFREVTGGGGGVGPEHQRDLGGPGRDGSGQFGEKALRPLAADHVEDRPGRLGADPPSHRARVVRRVTQRSRTVRAGILELPDAGGDLDRRRDPGGSAVIERRLRGCRSQLHGRHGAIIGRTDALGGLPHAHDDRRTRINGHENPLFTRESVTRAARHDAGARTFIARAGALTVLAGSLCVR
jgi:hypothetical protein